LLASLGTFSIPQFMRKVIKDAKNTNSAKSNTFKSEKFNVNLQQTATSMKSIPKK